MHETVVPFAPLYPVNRAHLESLSDAVGIMQHAIGSQPDPAHGYCTDDVARALQVDLAHADVLGWPAVAASAWRHLEFLVAAFDERSGRFRNFRSIGGAWNERRASEDSQGRAMHALGDAVAVGPERAFRVAAAAAFERALPGSRDVTAIRAVSSVVLGCAAVAGSRLGGAAAHTLDLLVDRLDVAFAAIAGRSRWPWPEPLLTYENALPARALIVAGAATRADGGRRGTRMLTTGIAVLDWLVSVQTAPDGHLSPVGNPWWPAGKPKPVFDQQPIEATATLLAAEAAYQATGDTRHLDTMEQAYAWFLGANDGAVPVADPASGACFDGLTPKGVNANQGAESTLMWLLALEQIRAARLGRGASRMSHSAAVAASVA